MKEPKGPLKERSVLCLLKELSFSLWKGEPYQETTVKYSSPGNPQMLTSLIQILTQGSTEVPLPPTIIYLKLSSPSQKTSICVLQGQDHRSPLRRLIRMIQKVSFRVLCPSLHCKCLIDSYCSGKRGCEINHMTQMHIPGCLQPKAEVVLRSFHNASYLFECPKKPLTGQIY